MHSILPQLDRRYLPVLRIVNKNLQECSSLADQDGPEDGSNKSEHLERAARTMNKAFAVCATDRFSSYEESRKWGVYMIVNLLFKTYFKLATTNLCGTIIKSLVSAGIAPLETFGKQEYSLFNISRVTFSYYSGVLAFFNESFDSAALNLQYHFALI